MGWLKPLPPSGVNFFASKAAELSGNPCRYRPLDFVDKQSGRAEQ